MLTFLMYFVLIINSNQMNGFYLFWDTLFFVNLPAYANNKILMKISINNNLAVITLDILY